MRRVLCGKCIQFVRFYNSCLKKKKERRVKITKKYINQFPTWTSRLTFESDTQGRDTSDRILLFRKEKTGLGRGEEDRSTRFPFWMRGGAVARHWALIREGRVTYFRSPCLHAKSETLLVRKTLKSYKPREFPHGQRGETFGISASGG